MNRIAMSELCDAEESRQPVSRTVHATDRPRQAFERVARAEVKCSAYRGPAGSRRPAGQTANPAICCSARTCASNADRPVRVRVSQVIRRASPRPGDAALL